MCAAALPYGYEVIMFVSLIDNWCLLTVFLVRIPSKRKPSVGWWNRGLFRAGTITERHR